MISDELPDGTISNMPWRKTNVKYTQNEIYLDIIEEIDSIIDNRGDIYVCMDVYIVYICVYIVFVQTYYTMLIHILYNIYYTGNIVSSEVTGVIIGNS